MLERIALHQTRLRTPGLGTDGKGIALGAKGLVLFPSIDRLVAFLGVYTQERSLEDLMASLVLSLVRSKLGTREIVLEIAAESSDRMDRVAETARAVGAFTFTGTSRHFVQYRDAKAPFGYDIQESLPSSSGLALYHERFTQSYDVEKPLSLRSLVLRLMPHVDPSSAREGGPVWILAEQGLGAALIHYFVRSRVEGQVAVVEWPPASAFDEGPVRRTLVRLRELPGRMRPLFTGTPGITVFRPASDGVAVEVGFRHPLALRAVPVFDPEGLVLVRGRGEDPFVVEKLPTLGALEAFARVDLRDDDRPDGLVATRALAPETVSVPLRVLPSNQPWRNVTATWIEGTDLSVLRKIAYALPHATVRSAEIAVTDKGVLLRSMAGIEAIPVGTFLSTLRRNLYVAAGFEVVPAVSPEVLAKALGFGPGQVIVLGHDARALALDESSFVPLERVLLEAPPWEPVASRAIDVALEERPVTLKLEPLGSFALRGVESAPRVLPERSTTDDAPEDGRG
ncbi:MAG: hypothetical protein U0169_12190 [Polyangiaceae bacterium]